MSESRSDRLNFREVVKNADLPGKTALVLSSWFGVGLMPIAPGTFGTLAAIPVVFVTYYLKSLFGALFILIFIALAFWASDLGRKHLGKNDPSEVVIDEVAGFLVTMFLLPLSWLSLILGFILFRVFDIIKPFPIRRLEKIKGGFGIVLDDLLAGIYANISLRILLFLLRPGGG